ncbi:SMC-Scp complex subunit ScpB [Priestia koreensis]|uniref:SMC-Scp complex subunit ScpB n=1 Tax=Priestia koreensis TaxID=284581 RepID=UPI001F595F5C|nr:SMC-Scp complex subunit ScpB [Priestia koreensis]MCM3003968.1 SMC-Scp complex subunit ScpB [Priestia koreensis]
MNNQAIIESLLFVAGDQGLSLNQLSTILEMDEKTVSHLMSEFSKSYHNEDRGLELIEVADVYKLVTKKESAEYIKKLVDIPASQSLSQAALETLAIVAYRQPITRVEIEEVRGVKTERPLQTLVAKALIKEVGRAEGAGRAILYGTTNEFMDYFGLKTLKDLPPLPEDMKEQDLDQETDLFFEKFNEIAE